MSYRTFQYIILSCTACLAVLWLNSCTQKPDVITNECEIFNSVLLPVLDSIHLSLLAPPLNGRKEDVYKQRQMLIIINDSTEILPADDQIQFSKYYKNIRVAIDSSYITKNNGTIITFKNNDTHRVLFNFPKTSKYTFRYFSTTGYGHNTSCCGKLGLSKVKLDDSGTYAVFTVSFHGCQYYSSGNGCRVYVRKINGRWQVDRIIQTWIT